MFLPVDATTPAVVQGLGLKARSMDSVMPTASERLS